jgi:hypothetical protein
LKVQVKLVTTDRKRFRDNDAAAVWAVEQMKNRSTDCACSWYEVSKVKIGRVVVLFALATQRQRCAHGNRSQTREARISDDRGLLKERI